MNKDFDAVQMVRKIRDDIYEQTKDMSTTELVEFFQAHSLSAKEKRAQVENQGNRGRSGRR